MNNKKRTVLVTGSNGLLGQKLTDKYLVDTEVRLITTGKGPNRYPTAKGHEYVVMDVCNLDQIMDVFDRFEPDTIIHTAAMTNVDACELDPQACELLNVTAVEYLVKASNRINAHFIHLSTDFIFDGKNGPYAEDDEANPVSIYGHSKLKGEEIVRKHAKSWAIARTVLVYGLVNDMSRSNIVLWAKNALVKGEEIRVVDDQFRSPTLAKDLAQGCFLIESQKAEGVFNISGKDFMSIYELVQRVGKHFNLSTECMKQIDSKSLNQPAKRPPVTGFDLTKSREVLGYEPHSFEEGIEIMYKQFVSFDKTQ